MPKIFLNATSPTKGACSLGSKCMPLIEGKSALEAALIKTYARAPDRVLLLICGKSKQWKPVESYPEFQSLFERYAKHWFVAINDKPTGPFSREQLKLLKEGKTVGSIKGFTLTPQSKVWSGLRMKDGEYRRAETVDELYFNVFNIQSSSDDEIVL